MKTNIERLKEMGCGNEIINSCIERGEISANINNTKTFLKYYKYAVKSNLMTYEQAKNQFLKYYNSLINIEYLAKKYEFLYLEKFSQIKLKSEKFINN